MIGQKNDLPLFVVIPNNYTAKKVRAFCFCPEAGKADELIGKDFSVLWKNLIFHYLEDGIFLMPGNKEDSVLRPLAE